MYFVNDGEHCVTTFYGLNKFDLIYPLLESFKLIQFWIIAMAMITTNNKKEQFSFRQSW